MTTRQIQVLLYQLDKDGTVELPEGAVIISLVFESEGAYGSSSRPSAAWVEVLAAAT